MTHPTYTDGGQVVDPFGCGHDQAGDWPHHTVTTNGASREVCAVDGRPFPCPDAEQVPEPTSAIVEGDRITLLTGDNAEYAIRADRVTRDDTRVPAWAPPRPAADAVWLWGHYLKGNGHPFTTGHTAAWVHGLAGTTWARWETRRPANIGRPPTRHRLMMIDGDGEPVTRTATHFDASVSMWIAGDHTSRADMSASRVLTLTGGRDGSWLLTVREAWTAGGRDSGPVTVAAGHIDDQPGAIRRTARVPVEALTDGALAELLAEVRAESDRRQDVALVQHIREVLVAAGHCEVVRVEFTGQEWDNGYFLDADGLAYDASGVFQRVDFDGTPAREALAYQNRTRDLGARARLIVDLVAGTVEHTNYEDDEG